MRKILVSLAVVAIVIFSHSLKKSYAEETAYRYIEDSVPRVIIEGVGKINAKPDEAVVRLGIINEEKSLKKAFERQTKDMNEVISKIKALGIKEEDIKTTHYSVIPRYKDNKIIWGWGRRKPKSFEVSHQLTVKIKDLSKVGDLIDKVIEAGAIYIYGLEFKSSKMEDLQKEVRLKAAKNAREKAQILAEGANFKLGRVLKVDEAMKYPISRRRAYGPVYEEMALSKAADSPQIESGSIELKATCTIIYEIVE